MVWHSDGGPLDKARHSPGDDPTRGDMSRVGPPQVPDGGDNAATLVTAEPIRPANDPSQVNPSDAVLIATASWADEDLLDSTVERMSQVAHRFAKRVASRRSILDVSVEDCEEFIHAATRSGEPPSLATMHFRRTTLRAVYRSLRYQQLTDIDPTIDLALEPKSVRRTRPLTDEEINLLRLCALGRATTNLRGAVALALAEATATTREIPLVTVGDLDADASSIRLPGGGRVEPRVVSLTAWGAGVITRHLGDGAGDGDRRAGSHLLPVRGDTHRLPAQASTCNLIAVLLDNAGLRTEPDVRPGSIRAWAGAAAYRRTGCIEVAARLLGLRSLDATAELIAHDWRHV